MRYFTVTVGALVRKRFREYLRAMGLPFTENKFLGQSEFHIYGSNADKEMVRRAIKEFQS
jgi:hypothetical protein